MPPGMVESFMEERHLAEKNFDEFKYTAASKHFGIHTYLLVRNLENGRRGSG
jgi:rare lipoprotein A (peptidoglycan hydrolase)